MVKSASPFEKFHKFFFKKCVKILKNSFLIWKVVIFLKPVLKVFRGKFSERTRGLKIVVGINTRIQKNYILVIQVYVIFSDGSCNYIKKTDLGGVPWKLGGFIFGLPREPFFYF